ncbi:hypothetical protein F0562_014035 [Nyssa sinensis]|uniref:Uncharacterized protein n=1 Tax=Nyssa sinensis TaxID=561372 RepID=A0A5J4ZP77_9ASTE|nr:hypothetical protein F0562_014035 [Nyssa sinensis]
MKHRMLTFDKSEIECSGEPVLRLSDTVFEFLDSESEGSPENVSIGGGDDENGNSESVEDNKTFWETQHQILHATLCRTSSLETRVRNISKEAVKEIQLAGNVCDCRRLVAGGCRNCLMREICGRLQNAGFNSAMCKSKWRSSLDIPSGEHTYLDVVGKVQF